MNHETAKKNFLYINGNAVGSVNEKANGSTDSSNGHIGAKTNDSGNGETINTIKQNIRDEWKKDILFSSSYNHHIIPIPSTNTRSIPSTPRYPSTPTSSHSHFILQER